jgi:cytochrome P450
MTHFPSIGFLNLLRLGGSLTVGFLRHPGQFNGKAALLTELRQLTVRLDRPEGLILNLFLKKILLICDRDLSDRILAAEPSQQTYVAGKLKQNSMAVLAPEALTVSQDEQWQRLRPYNEKVLATDTQHPYRAAFLAQVQSAFQDKVTNLDDIRQRMGTAMLGIVFGGNRQDSQQLVNDVRKLFELVENPLKRLVLGRFQTRRRQRLYGALRQRWQESQTTQSTSLLAMAHAVHPPDLDETVLLQQIPHWMFTFTGSGSTLLGRTLTLITAQPNVLARVQQELETHCPNGQPQTPDTIAQLTYLEACLLETGRLYPPVMFTLHRAPQGDEWKQWQIPAGIDILQVFPLMQLPSERDLKAGDFQPERWLATSEQDEELPYSNLFLSGARACPGQDLILFVCKGAIAHLLTDQTLKTSISHFSQDPWPLVFPDKDIRFQSQSPS